MTPGGCLTVMRCSGEKKRSEGWAPQSRTNIRLVGLFAKQAESFASSHQFYSIYLNISSVAISKHHQSALVEV